MNDIEILEKDFKDSLIVYKGDYPYYVDQMQYGAPPLSKELIEAATNSILAVSKLDCDLILAPEAMAIQYAAALTLRTGIPFQVIRKKGIGVPGELVFGKSTGYDCSTMYINFLKKGTRVIIVDAVVSTGGTLRAIVNTLRENGIIVEEAVMLHNKSKDLPALEKELNLKIKAVLNVAVVDGKPVCSKQF